jgi:energy-coupling factor transporter ATP-binding protein EcfA2
MRVRTASKKLSTNILSTIIAEGALSAFDRVEQVEINSIMRTSTGQNSNQNTIYTLESVAVTLDHNLLLQDISLTINKGEWIALCGPSGSGKTTMLKLMSGIAKPTQGTITILDTEITPRTSLKNRLQGSIAFLHQNPEHHFIASIVFEDIAWGLHHQKVDSEQVDRRVNSIAKALQIDHILYRPCHKISFGEQQRVALAGLLVLNPKILLLDEPTSSLDNVSAQNLIRLVDEVCGDEITCVWVTHKFDQMPARIQRIILLCDNTIVFDGSKQEGMQKSWLTKARLFLD